MSVNFLVLIPTNPTYIPDTHTTEKARELLASFLPDADGVEVVVAEGVEFVDAGANFVGIRCPECEAKIDRSWWQSVMDAAYVTRFENLMVDVPCCGMSVSLNDLDYEFPMGFARFMLRARNPKREGIGEDELADLGALLRMKNLGEGKGRHAD